MKHQLRKQVNTGVGADLFMVRELPIDDFGVPPPLSEGRVVTVGRITEKVLEVTVDFNDERVSYWVAADDSISNSVRDQKIQPTVALDLLAEKMRAYQNDGWVVQR